MSSGAGGPMLAIPSEQIARWHASPNDGPSPELGALLYAVAETPWQLTLQRSDAPLHHFAAVAEVGLETVDDGELFRLQPFERADMAARIAGRVTALPAAPLDQPLRRPARIPPVMLQAMIGDPEDHVLELVDLLGAQDPAFVDALGSADAIHHMELAAPGGDLVWARLVIVSSEAHGRWALWQRVDIHEPWAAGMARVQRVDDARLLELVEATVADLMDPAADLVAASPDGEHDTHAAGLEA